MCLRERDDQIIFVRDIAGMHGGGDMQNAVDIGESLPPAFVTQEVCGDEAQVFCVVHTRILEDVPHSGLLGECSDAGSDKMTCFEELKNAMAGDETGTAGDENVFLTHDGIPLSS
jgi:hypothetical protein